MGMCVHRSLLNISSKEGKAMQLTYRAASYELNSTEVKPAASLRIGCYRGAKINFHLPTATSQAKSPVQLKYRGATYTTWR